MAVNELKYDAPLIDGVNSGKSIFANLTGTDVSKIKLVGVIFCYVEEKLAFSGQAKMWSQDGIWDEFEDSGTAEINYPGSDDHASAGPAL